ncbi:MAG: hypothetical protein EXX96DRAFT_622620 [Benjaminiella poitrasii]|nr:MAG: hypothetical protein EXX96DRAFT_622620 [Benjaminiella poitrasii]
MVVAQDMVTRPANTTKAYASKQEEWKCTKEQKFHDGCFEWDVQEYSVFGVVSKDQL